MHHVKQVFSFLIPFISGILCYSVSLAQDVEGYQFHYETDSVRYSFKITGFNTEMDSLPKEILNRFKEDQKASTSTASLGLTTASWGKSILLCDSCDTADIHYAIYQYDTLPRSPSIHHIYDHKGKLLYSISSNIKQIDVKVVHKLREIADYFTREDQMSEYKIYSINRDRQINNYLIDIYSGLKDEFLPNPSSMGESEENALRLIVDKKMTIVAIYSLFGNSTELRELQLMSPMF